jgi:signal peptidase II
VGILVGVAIAVLVVDQVTKALVVANMPGRADIDVLGEWLQITYTRNPGAAFSLGGGLTVLLTVIAIAVVVFIFTMASRLGSFAWAVALGALLGGALGNLSDRLFREPGPFRGYVVDWIQVPHYPVFNIADSAVVCGAIAMVYLSLRGRPMSGGRTIVSK